MKTRNMSLALSIVAALSVSLPERPASATPVEVGNLPTIRSIALGRGLLPETQLLAILTQNSTGRFGLNVMSIENLSASGSAASELEEDTYLAGTLPLVEPSLPGDPAWHVFLISLDSFIQQVQVSQDSAGRYQLSDPTTIGQFGNPTVHGRPTAIAVLPTPRDPTGPWFAIGTDTGNIILAKAGIQPCQLPVGGPVVDLAVVPQVGYFAFVALVNRSDGQHLVGIRPSEAGTCLTAPPQIVFDLTAGIPLEQDIKVFTSEPLLCDPLCSPLQIADRVSLLGSNGTRFVHRLTIPADPTIGGTFNIRSLKAADSPIAQAAAGSSSLAMLPVDGAGVLYDPGFRMDRGGVSGKLLTIFGSSLEVRPRRLSLQGRRPTVSIFIEVAGGNAALIVRTSIQLTIGGTALANDLLSPQLPADNDHDGNLDLEVKINRDAVQSSIPIGATSVTIAAQWRFNDGSVGRASAEIRIKSQGDDDDEDND